MNCFEDKVAVITGAGSGIGRALAQQLAARGARLALSDVNAKGLAETRKSLSRGSRQGPIRSMFPAAMRSSRMPKK